MRDRTECVHVSKQILTKGSWEADVTLAMTLAMGPPSDKKWFLDVGGHIGWWTVLMARLGHK